MVVFLTGCTLFPQKNKTVFVEPKAFEFVKIDVNLSEVKRVEPFPLEGKISFVDDTNSSIKMKVNTWLKIRSLNAEKDAESKRLRLHKIMLRKALDEVNRQIDIYKSTKQ